MSLGAGFCGIIMIYTILIETIMNFLLIIARWKNKKACLLGDRLFMI